MLDTPGLFAKFAKVSKDPNERLPAGKAPLGSLSWGKLDENDGNVWQAKLDGAFMYYTLDPDGIRAYSWRRSKRDGQPIEHTEKLYGLSGATVPKHLQGAILQGEAWDPGRTSSEVGAVLNARKDPHPGELRPAIHGIASLPGIDVNSLTNRERVQALKRIAKEVGVFDLPDMATTPEQKKALKKAISSGEHPQTSEGLVIYPSSGIPIKAVIRPTLDVPVVGFTDGLGQFEDSGIGALLVGSSDSPSRVGTGFTESMRRAFWEKPELLKGLVAKIEVKEVFPSGKFRGASFKGFHPEKSDPDALAKLDEHLKSVDFSKSAAEGTHAQGEFAPGIPFSRDIKPLPEAISQKLWEIAIHDHLADKAGKHYDLRLGDPETGHAHSWALPKATLPDEKQRMRLAIQQPTHTMEYMDFEGEIPEGYGKGQVALPVRGQTPVDASPGRLQFKIPGKGTFVLRQQGNDQWMLLKKGSKVLKEHPGEFSKYAGSPIKPLLAAILGVPLAGAAIGVYQHPEDPLKAMSGGAIGGAAGAGAGALTGASLMALLQYLGGTGMQPAGLAAGAVLGGLAGTALGAQEGAQAPVGVTGASRDRLLEQILQQLKQKDQPAPWQPDLLR